MDGGQVHRGVQAVVGDLVSVGVRDAGDEAAGAEAVQVIGDRVGWCCPQFGDQWAEIFVGDAVGLGPKQRQRGEQGMAAPLTPGAGLGCGCRSRW